jgi:hypothetical protein
MAAGPSHLLVETCHTGHWEGGSASQNDRNLDEPRVTKFRFGQTLVLFPEVVYWMHRGPLFVAVNNSSSHKTPDHKSRDDGHDRNDSIRSAIIRLMT